MQWHGNPPPEWLPASMGKTQLKRDGQKRKAVCRESATNERNPNGYYILGAERYPVKHQDGGTDSHCGSQRTP